MTPFDRELPVPSSCQEIEDLLYLLFEAYLEAQKLKG